MRISVLSADVCSSDLPSYDGKSTLSNALAKRELAIVSPVAGTTRDVIETPLALDGIAMRFSDTAGLRGEGAEAIEAIGIDRAKAAVAAADILLWLGPPEATPAQPHAIRIAPPADRWRGGAAAEARAAERKGGGRGKRGGGRVELGGGRVS